MVLSISAAAAVNIPTRKLKKMIKCCSLTFLFFQAIKLLKVLLSDIPINLMNLKFTNKNIKNEAFEQPNSENVHKSSTQL